MPLLGQFGGGEEVKVRVKMGRRIGAKCAVRSFDASSGMFAFVCGYRMPIGTHAGSHSAFA